MTATATAADTGQLTHASTLEPHQLAAFLQAPTHEQQISYVVEHCNYILPQLASDSLAASLRTDSNTSSTTPIFTTLPSSFSLEAYLAQLTYAHKQASARNANLESQLRNQLLSSLDGVKLLKQKLSSLPDDIASTEDKLLDLCEDLVIAGASSAAPESSREGAVTLINRLDQLHTAIDQLQKAKAYFSILAQAEDLRLAIIECDQDQAQAQQHQALQHLSQLDALVRKVEKLSAVGSRQLQPGTKEPNLVAFLRAQRSAAFKTLRKARCARLSHAIEQTGWPQAKPDLSSQHDASIQLDSSAAKLVESTQVKQAWAQVCQLQDTAEHLGLLERATAKPSSNADAQNDVIAAASDKYQPLLTTQCLIEPMLLRFRYHFDGDRSTNRLDKPEWFISHIAALIRSQAPLFLPAVHGVPGSGGAVVRLNRAFANQASAASTRKAYRHIDTYAELLHGLLTPLRRKLASTMPALLEHPSLLAHTVFQALTFDADLADSFPPSLTVLNAAGTRKISDDILDNTAWFNRWLDGEKEFALRRFDEIINSPDAWAIGGSDSLADDDEQIFYSSLSDPSGPGTSTEDAAGQRTTKSARSTIEILDSVSERYRPLPSLSQRLSFVAIVQLPILRTYAQRLTRSLDAFESLSSAFARAMPGEIVSGTGATSGGSDSDMVKGLRGLGRLVKALLSAQYVCTELERWSESAAFVEMSASLDSTEEGRALALGLRKDQGAEEDRELDAASLGMLLRRGLKRGAAVARPLASSTSGGGGGGSPVLPSGDTGAFGTPKLSDVGSKQVLNEFGRYGVWEEPRRKFAEIAARAITAIERLVTSEVLEQLRPYMLRRWDQEDLSNEEQQDDAEPYPTPTLIPALSIFSSHLGHLASILERETLLPIYRHISTSIASALVERVVMSGGSKRFNYAGGVRFDRDLREGWLGVVRELVESNAVRGAMLLGRKPEACWKAALDAAVLLRLPSSTGGGGEQGEVTLAKAVQIVFDATDEGQIKGEEYKGLLERLGHIDDAKINVREVLRRRVEVWK